jgi:hypothetical protein
VNDGTRWLTTEDAARYAGYHRPKSFLEWARVHKVPRGKAGRSNRWLREDIDKALQPPDWAAMGYFRKRA